ncbi:MAG: SusC/RagA family TonB-linked outer membrane protein [Bacteroidia bacterium]|nr:SusC/RagA family TonB-linked outer membrane protein [Bacteroidia bacterium]
MKDAEISRVLSAIEKQGSFRFLFNSRLKDLKQKVNITFRDAEITEVLDTVFSGTFLRFKKLDNNLIAIRSENPAEQDIQITGRITGEAGEPLGGVSISIKGTSRGTTTDNNGNFTISTPENATLVISYIGYVSQEVAVNSRNVINVQLAPSARKVDEVVVIGYGVAAKRDLTGSIVKVSGKEVADKPNVNPVASLQGKVAGVSIVNSGTPGQEPDIRIRGTNSLSPGGTKPLYLVDGIFNDNIGFLNPNDIETIEILKDPSSLAIFGVRGANGVIAITTKKAKSGQVNINFNTTFSAKKLVDKIEMVNAEEFKLLYEEEQTNLGITGANRFDFTPWTGNTDWVDEMTRTGLMVASNLSLSSATDKNKFYFGIGYTNEEGIIRHEQLRRITINLNDEVKVGKGIKLGFTLNAVRQRNPYSAARGLLFNARRVLPITPVYDAARGAYYNLAIQSGQMINPVME